MKALKALTMSVSVFRGRIPWHFSLSKNNISPAAPDLELILVPLWYWPIMNTHTKQQQDKAFETDFIDSQKSDPLFVHLLALSHTHVYCMFAPSYLSELLHLYNYSPSRSLHSSSDVCSNSDTSAAKAMAFALCHTLAPTYGTVSPKTSGTLLFCLPSKVNKTFLFSEYFS